MCFSGLGRGQSDLLRESEAGQGAVYRLAIAGVVPTRASCQCPLGQHLVKIRVKDGIPISDSDESPIRFRGSEGLRHDVIGSDRASTRLLRDVGTVVGRGRGDGDQGQGDGAGGGDERSLHEVHGISPPWQ